MKQHLSLTNLFFCFWKKKILLRHVQSHVKNVNKAFISHFKMSFWVKKTVSLDCVKRKYNVFHCNVINEKKHKLKCLKTEYLDQGCSKCGPWAICGLWHDLVRSLNKSVFQQSRKQLILPNLKKIYIYFKIAFLNKTVRHFLFIGSGGYDLLILFFKNCLLLSGSNWKKKNTVDKYLQFYFNTFCGPPGV